MMLDSHPDLAIPPETNFLPRVSRKCSGVANPSNRFVETLTSFTRWPDFHLDGDSLKQRVAAIHPFALSDALRAFYTLYAEQFGKPRWGDKTPRYLEHMICIQELLPEARFIHLIRDGRDVALSTLDLWFGPSSIPEAADWWLSKINKAREQAKDLRFYLEIRYEDLVLDSESTLRRVCDYIDLPWNRSMLEYYKRAEERVAELNADVTAPDGTRRVPVEERRRIFAMTRNPPDASRVGRWRKEMSTSDYQRFQRVAGAMLVELGYDRGELHGT
jgi:hypothetical protein